MDSIPTDPRQPPRNPRRSSLAGLTPGCWAHIYRMALYRTAIESTMRPARREPEQLLPLSVQVFHILLALADGERHGYAIMQDVVDRSGGEVRLGPGTLYGAIKRLLERGVVTESEARPEPEEDDERRRYYALTPFGHEVLAAEAKRLERMMSALESVKLSPRARPS